MTQERRTWLATSPLSEITNAVPFKMLVIMVTGGIICQFESPTRGSVVPTLELSSFDQGRQGRGDPTLVSTFEVSIGGVESYIPVSSNPAAQLCSPEPECQTDSQLLQPSSARSPRVAFASTYHTSSFARSKGCTHLNSSIFLSCVLRQARKHASVNSYSYFRSVVLLLLRKSHALKKMAISAIDEHLMARGRQGVQTDFRDS